MTGCEEINALKEKRLTFDVRIKLDGESDRNEVVKFLNNAEESCPIAHCWATELARIIEKG